MAKEEKHIVSNGFNLKSKINTVSYYKELAEMDLLLDYVQTYLPEKFSADEQFRKEIFKIIYEDASKATPELEVFLLDKLIHSLSYFNELLNEWNHQSR